MNKTNKLYLETLEAIAITLTREARVQSGVKARTLTNQSEKVRIRLYNAQRINEVSHD